MIPIIWPYKMGSASAKVLAQELGARRVYFNRRYRPRTNHVIINWGNTKQAPWEYYLDHTQMINPSHLVRRASDKVQCINALSRVGSIPIPAWAVTRGEAERLFENASKVFCRTLTRANSGRGIIIANSPEELVDAPLYTANIGKRTEYRVHVVAGQVIDFAQKKKMNDERIADEGISFSWAIRSHDNGWVFARSDIDLPDAVSAAAVDAVTALGLDFAAVDCYYTSVENPTPQVAGVFEVNTAPGLEGTTLQRYVHAFQEVINA